MNDNAEQRRVVSVMESSRIPVLDIVFAFGPTLLFVFGDALAWWLPMPARTAALHVTALWGCAILLFLSGVRRGLSFRTEDGPTVSQMLTMLTLFCLGFGALTAVWLGELISSAVVLLAGYGIILVLDPLAAQSGEAPLYFKRLRRMQIPIVLLSLIALALIAATATIKTRT